MAKKKKRSAEQMHRQLQDSLQALPVAIADHEKNGRRGKALMLRYVGGPLIKLLNGVLNRQRYKGPDGVKLKQSEKMKRHLEQRQKAMEYVQGEMRKAQKAQKTRRAR